MGTCTVIALPRTDAAAIAISFMPIREALDYSDTLRTTGIYIAVRVYSEAVNGDLRLIYVAK